MSDTADGTDWGAGALPPRAKGLSVIQKERRGAFARRAFLMSGLAVVAGCGGKSKPDRRPPVRRGPPLYPNETPELRRKINYWADYYDVPRGLVHRVVIRESTHRPKARNGPYYGLMQILPATARGMGYRGSDIGLLDADANLEFAVKYLRGAYMVADGDWDDSVKWYARGYYYEAKRKGLLKATGLR